MALDQSPDRVVEVRARERGQGLGSPEGDLPGAGSPVCCGISHARPAGVALAAHARHRIRVARLDEGSIRGALHRIGAGGRPRLEVLGDPPPNPRTVGILPGSFDPMTTAHAALGDALRGHGCDPVLLLWSPRTMPKEGPSEPPLLPPDVRVASMLRWAGNREGFRVALSSHGLYVDQATATAGAFPGSDIVIGLGSDKVAQLFDPSWYGDHEAALALLLRLARVAYAVRAGEEATVGATLDRAGRWRGRLLRLALPPDIAGVSSSGVRRRLRRGEAVSDLVPEEVLAYLPPG